MALVYTAGTMIQMLDPAGTLIAFDYRVAVTMDGTEVHIPIPENTEALEQIKAVVARKLVRLKHISIGTTDAIPNAGHFAVYPFQGYVAGVGSHCYDFKLQAENIGKDVDMLIRLYDRTFGLLGLVDVFFLTAPTSSSIVTVRLFFEVV